MLWRNPNCRRSGKLTMPMIVVPDVLRALEHLGAASRARSHAQIIAVTGSAGKTTTKEALRHVLSNCGKSACLGSVVQQSLGRAAHAGADAGRTPNTACLKSA